MHAASAYTAFFVCGFVALLLAARETECKSFREHSTTEPQVTPKTKYTVGDVEQASVVGADDEEWADWDGKVLTVDANNLLFDLLFDTGDHDDEVDEAESLSAAGKQRCLHANPYHCKQHRC